MVTEANEVIALEVIAADGYNLKTYIVMEYCDKGTLEQHRCMPTDVPKAKQPIHQSCVLLSLITGHTQHRASAFRTCPPAKPAIRCCDKAVQSGTDMVI